MPERAAGLAPPPAHPPDGEPPVAANLLVLVPSGVTVVTARDGDRRDHGMTVAAFTPVSVDPPLVLVCIARRAWMHTVLRGASHFAVNVLPACGAATARRFAARVPDRFAGVEVDRGAGGAPLLRGVVAHLECEVERRYWGGDHSIFVGRVVAGRAYGGEPLVYLSHAFGRADLREPSRARTLVEDTPGIL